jgi:hypothetical protein
MLPKLILQGEKFISYGAFGRLQSKASIHKHKWLHVTDFISDSKEEPKKEGEEAVSFVK